MTRLLRLVDVGWSWLAVAILVSFGGGCQDKEEATRDIKRRCDQVEYNLRPGSGVPWVRADGFMAWVDANPSMLSREALDDYATAVDRMKETSNRKSLTADEHTALFTAALTARGLSVPDCRVLHSYRAQYESYSERVAHLEPLCDAYEERARNTLAGSNGADHDRVFKEAASAWRQDPSRSVTVLNLVDALLGFELSERGKWIRAAFEVYMTAPGIFGACKQLVWHAERAAGLPWTEIQ